ncbi:DUF4917 family protein [Anaerospora hongkongensis]|uniref:DUF4917 family protein n=1 Tax=Anaerospora hongkongensis TaxID=244830 RepID=UPI0028991A1B|nr:DUF4917 family protein [Anaerospora hongkongensis]
MEIKEWKDIKGRGYNALILGNGASIAVNPCFSYSSLYKLMQDKKVFSESIDKVFNYLETSDFELVLNRMWHSYHINQALEIVDQKTIAAYAEIRQILINAVRENHVQFGFTQFYIESIYRFLQEFKTIISLNYDLILYWSMLYGNKALGTWFKDCFIHGEFRDDWEDLRDPYQASGSTLVFYPHGNLVLARTIYGEEHKLMNRLGVGSDNTDNLLNHIFSCWENGKDSPLFVSEGDSKQKVKAIRRSSYLSKVYDSVLPRIGNNIVIYGWSLAEQDEHIVKQVCNRTVKTIAVSVYTGRSDTQVRDEMLRILANIRKYNNDAEVIFFDSNSAGCWIND